VTAGIISAKERTVNPDTPYADFLQTDASIIRVTPAGRCST